MKSKITRTFVTLAFLTLVHACLTLALYISYMEYAMEVFHELRPGTESGQVLQYLKSVFLWPILLPFLRSRPDLLRGLNGFLLLFINSFLWIFCGWLMIRGLLRLRHTQPGGRIIAATTKVPRR